MTKYYSIHTLQRVYNSHCLENVVYSTYVGLGLVFPQSFWEHAGSAVKQVPTSIVVAGFPTRLAVSGIPARRVVTIFPTTSLVGRLPQQGLWDWHTI